MRIQELHHDVAPLGPLRQLHLHLPARGVRLEVGAGPRLRAIHLQRLLELFLPEAVIALGGHLEAIQGYYMAFKPPLMP